MIDPDIKGRVALVTGGNHGIGAAIATALAAQGAPVFITYLRLGPDTADATAAETYAVNRGGSADSVVERITGRGGRAVAWEADLADPGCIPDVFARAESALGPVEILVHNAAAWKGDSFVEEETDRHGRKLTAVTAATHDLHFAVNSRATALLIAEYARRHRARTAAWGRIITITTGGSAGFPEEISYGASKNALESYTVAAAWELGRFGITANVVCPAATDTGWIPARSMATIAEGSPLHHVGAPQEVADVVVFLASEQARAVTGTKVTLR